MIFEKLEILHMSSDYATAGTAIMPKYIFFLF